MVWLVRNNVLHIFIQNAETAKADREMSQSAQRVLCDCKKQGFTKAMSVIKEACSPSDTESRPELKQDESNWVAGAQCIPPTIAWPTVEQIDVSIIRVIKIMPSRTSLREVSIIGFRSILCFSNVSELSTSKLSLILNWIITILEYDMVVWMQLVLYK